MGNEERMARLTTVLALQFYFKGQEMVSVASWMTPMYVILVEKGKLTVYVIKVDIKLINP